MLVSVYKCHHTMLSWGQSIQYVTVEWEPRQWEPSWNLPQFLQEKWELSYLGPGGLDSVFYLPCTVYSLVRLGISSWRVGIVSHR